jgi:hypothetical protein
MLGSRERPKGAHHSIQDPAQRQGSGEILRGKRPLPKLLDIRVTRFVGLRALAAQEPGQLI